MRATPDAANRQRDVWLVNAPNVEGHVNHRRGVRQRQEEEVLRAAKAADGAEQSTDGNSYAVAQGLLMW